MSCTASSSWRQSSPDLTMTGLTAQAGRRPWGDSDCILLHLASNLHEMNLLILNPYVTDAPANRDVQQLLAFDLETSVR